MDALFMLLDALMFEYYPLLYVVSHISSRMSFSGSINLGLGSHRFIQVIITDIG